MAHPLLLSRAIQGFVGALQLSDVATPAARQDIGHSSAPRSAPARISGLGLTREFRYSTRVSIGACFGREKSGTTIEGANRWSFLFRRDRHISRMRGVSATKRSGLVSFLFLHLKNRARPVKPLDRHEMVCNNASGGRIWGKVGTESKAERLFYNESGRNF